MDYFVIETTERLSGSTLEAAEHFFPASNGYLLVTEERYVPPHHIDTPIVAVRGYVEAPVPQRFTTQPIAETHRSKIASSIEQYFFADSEIVFDDEPLEFAFDLEAAVRREPIVRSNTRFLE